MTDITEQEAFWKGQFGSQYMDRNKGNHWVAANSAFFSKVLEKTRDIGSILELGPNIGLNIAALKHLMPKTELSGVEINEKAALELKEKIPGIDLHLMSILDFQPGQRKWDLVFTKGVLIHINPDKLSKVYDLMYNCSSRYILICEYYNPKPVEISYHGHRDKLFKRDFAGEMLETYSALSLVNYGFVYHRDPNFPQDDMNWFLLEK